MSIHGVGKWQTVVLWYEIDPADQDGLILCEATFSTEDERNAHLAERVATGLVYDLVGVIDSSWVEVEDPLPEVEQTVENGLIPIKEIRDERAKEPNHSAIEGDEV